MKNEYQIRIKDIRSPEEKLDQRELVKDPVEIIDNLKFVFNMNNREPDEEVSEFDFRLEILRDKKSIFISKIDEAFDPNFILPYEFNGLRHLRQAIYRSGHILKKQSGIVSLEKLGFVLVEEKDRLFLIGDHRFVIPEGMSDCDLYHSVVVLIRYLSSEILDYTYMWSIDERGYTAMIKMDGKLCEDYLARFTNKSVSRL